MNRHLFASRRPKYALSIEECRGSNLPRRGTSGRASFANLIAKLQPSCALRSLLLVLCAVSLSACVGHVANVPDPLPVTPATAKDKAGQIWQTFSSRATSEEYMSGPFRISSSLRYTEKNGESTRVSSLLWGNGKKETPYPLRLDMLAGVGTVVAKVYEDEVSFIVYSPDDKTAYTHEGTTRTLATFGVPIPLSLSDLTLMLTGRSGALFLPEGKNAQAIPAERKVTENGAHFIIPDAKLPGELELDENGAPIQWDEINKNGWSITMEPGEKNPMIPKKLRIAHPGGYSALIVVKEIARVSPYTKQQMMLTLPAGTKKQAIVEE